MIRTAKIEDAGAMLEIYTHYVEHTAATFEITPPCLNEMERRIDECVTSADWIVCEENGAPVGYAYYGPFRSRKAYDYTCETTVYVHRERTGRGIGRALYGELIGRLRRTPMAVAVGCISLPNVASVVLHERMGFRHAGVLRNVGRKFNRWIDVGYWELELKSLPEYDPDRYGLAPGHGKPE